MIARIYQPARNAMQSGQAKTKNWVLETVSTDAKTIDPLMGWTGSSDTEAQVKLTFDSKEAAIEYANAKGIVYSVTDPKPRKHVVRQGGYAENFATNRRGVWTH